MLHTILYGCMCVCVCVCVCVCDQWIGLTDRTALLCHILDFNYCICTVNPIRPQSLFDKLRHNYYKSRS